MKVHFDKLPEWAKQTIENASPGTIIQTVRSNNALSISSRGIFFNGMEVTTEVVPDTEEETILLSELPDWAREKVLLTDQYSSVQNLIGTDSLQISDGIAYFNGKRVVKKEPANFLDEVLDNISMLR